MPSFGSCNQCGSYSSLINKLCMRCRLRQKKDVDNERLEQRLDEKIENVKIAKNREKIKLNIIKTPRPRKRSVYEKKITYKEIVSHYILNIATRPMTTGELSEVLEIKPKTIDYIMTDLSELGLIHRQYFKGDWHGKHHIKLAFHYHIEFKIVCGVGVSAYEFLKGKRKPVSVKTLCDVVGCKETAIRYLCINYPEIFDRILIGRTYHYFVKSKPEYTDGLIFVYNERSLSLQVN